VLAKLPEAASRPTHRARRMVNMNKTEQIKDKLGRLIGRIDDQGDERVAHDREGRLVGRYRKQGGQTLDKSGGIVTTKGDALSALLLRRKK
jgi:YD repeat-containing protein